MRTLYIDPGTGSMLISAVIALISVGFFMLKGVVYRQFNIGGDKGEILDPNHQYGLVFYSEGKQYWNVFKPLLEECNNRSFHATYFTSDKDDPGLDTELEYIEALYIGSGREAYFTLNRLHADMVIMTTPGLDVLELKRSKNVKHYSHISHAPGSFAGYKSYATDYFDSVLLGGDGDLEVIRELEQLRNLETKDITVIGHTYLDILREKIKDEDFDYNLFEEKRETILISPTWGNHGLLSMYGEDILSSLEDSDLFNVIIRPHPQSFISEEKLMDELLKKFPNNEHRVWDRDVENLNAMAHADIMISDFSGIIFDFYTLYKKPILTMHGQYEKRGRDAIDLKEDPWDIKMLDVIGKTISSDDVEKLPEIVSQTLEKYKDKSPVTEQDLNKMDKYPNEAGVRGVDYIVSVLEKVQVLDTSTVDKPIEETTEVVSGSWIRRTLHSLFSTSMLLQMTITAVLLTAYIYLGSVYLPFDGLNQIFLTFLLPHSVKVSLLVFALFLISAWFKNKGELLYKKSLESIELMDLLLVALPMTPIIQYIFANQDILSFKSSVIVFGFFLMISMIMIVVIPFILSPVVSKSLTVSISMSFLFIVLNMASFGLTTEVQKIAIILALISIGVFFTLFFKQKKILLIVVTILFVTNAGVSFFNRESVEVPPEITVTDSKSLLLEYTKDLEVKKTPDIYILIYDSYANIETMDQYGYDNRGQVNYLLKQGFNIYDGTYSLGASSLSSMSHVLSPDTTTYNDTEFRRLIAGDASGLGMLRKEDYLLQSVFDSDYLTRDAVSKYDLAFPDDMYSIDPHKIIIDAILEGEFRFDADFSTIDYEDYVKVKRDILGKKTNKSQFLYVHDEYPGHSQNSGVLLPNETELHLENLKIANEQMKLDIEKLDLPNKDAIVIIAGDHGPYLTKNGISLKSYDTSDINRLDIQDRFGTFLAIHWPEQEYAEKYDIKTIQDIMPAIAAYMYGDDSLFEKTRMDRELLTPSVVGGANVIDGIIHGGIDDGKPLFKHNEVKVNKKK